MALSEAEVLTCLKNVVDPNTGRDFVTAKEVKKVLVTGGDVAIDLALGYPAKSQHETLKQLIQGAVAALPGAGRVTVNVTTRIVSTPCNAASNSSRREEHRGGGERQGGVGKSDRGNLALALAAEGATDGADADIYGRRSRRCSHRGRPESSDGKTLEPMEAYGRAGDVDRLHDRRRHADGVARADGHTGARATPQGHEVARGRLPDRRHAAGHRRHSATLAQKVPVTGAVIVTTPQDIALLDARKGLKMFEKVGVPIVGIVENMSVHICSNCGHVEHIFGEGGAQKMCNDYGVPFLGALPLDIRIREQADSGRPTVVADPDSKVAQVYRDIAQGGVWWPRRRPTSRQISEHRRSEYVIGGTVRVARSAGIITRNARTIDDQSRQMDPPDGAIDA
jgi:ATP-binding protein involved in chromosome partitioning